MEMMVVSAVTAESEYRVTGDGYAPEGSGESRCSAMTQKLFHQDDIAAPTAGSVILNFRYGFVHRQLSSRVIGECTGSSTGSIR
jgi:hypothetical protein